MSLRYITPLPNNGSRFDPSQLPGLTLWLDATDNSTITGSSPVTAWKDKSPNGITYAAIGSPILMAGAINGKQCMSVTMADGFQDAAGTKLISASSGWYFYFVIQSYVAGAGLQASAQYPFNLVTNPAADAAYVQFFTGAPYNTWVWFGGATAQGWTNNALGISIGQPNPFTADTAPYDVGFEGTDFTTLANMKIFVNGASQAPAWTGADVGTVSSTTNLVQPTPGAAHNPTDYIAEVIVGNQALNPAQRSKLQTYLSGKWGV